MRCWLKVGCGAVQWAKTGRFQLYNYGSAATNIHVYKKPEPPDIAEGYHLLDIPLDIVAGKRCCRVCDEQQTALALALIPQMFAVCVGTGPACCQESATGCKMNLNIVPMKSEEPSTWSPKLCQ